MSNNVGQDKTEWSKYWENSYPIKEIQMWDYFGLRNWILKYVPRYGEVLEAGCGLGRYVFYLSQLGIDIEGVDFEKDIIDYLNKWGKNSEFKDLKFIKGDVTNLPYKNDSLSGYISLGVVEHFYEGPHAPIREALRVLRPGGIAIISVPSPSWTKRFFRFRTKFKNILKRCIGKKIRKKPFFQYEYTAKTLKQYVEREGFYISRFSNADMLYTFTELGGNTSKYIKQNSPGYILSHLLENSRLNILGAQSIVIGLKSADLMYCFLCGRKNVDMSSLECYDIPICRECQNDSNSYYYARYKKNKFNSKYQISPEIIEPNIRCCELCGTNFKTHYLFELYGLTKNVCPECLRNKDINIELSNTSVIPIWRSRSSVINSKY